MILRCHKSPFSSLVQSRMLCRNNSPRSPPMILRCHKSPFSSLVQSRMLCHRKCLLLASSSPRLRLRKFPPPPPRSLMLRLQKFPPSGCSPNSPPSPRFLLRKLSHLLLVVSLRDPLPPPSFSWSLPCSLPFPKPQAPENFHQIR